jgi:hypothetical protein
MYFILKKNGKTGLVIPDLGNTEARRLFKLWRLWPASGQHRETLSLKQNKEQTYKSQNAKYTDKYILRIINHQEKLN